MTQTLSSFSDNGSWYGVLAFFFKTTDLFLEPQGFCALLATWNDSCAKPGPEMRMIPRWQALLMLYFASNHVLKSRLKSFWKKKEKCYTRKTWPETSPQASPFRFNIQGANVSEDRHFAKKSEACDFSAILTDRGAPMNCHCLDGSVKATVETRANMLLNFQK